MVEQPRAREKRWAYLSRYVANETLYQLSYTPLFGTRRLARLANFSSRNADLYSSDEIVRPLKEIAPDFVHPPRSVVICNSTNNNPGNYEKRKQSRRHPLRRESGFFHTAYRANDAQELDSIFSFPERNCVSDGFARQTNCTIHSISWNDFRSRSKREDVRNCR